MNKYPNVWKLSALIKWSKQGAKSQIKDGSWVPARPLGYPSFIEKLKASWLVFTGKADVVIWPENENDN